MDKPSSSGYSKLAAVPGIVLRTCSNLKDVVCPFCFNADVAFLMGKVSLSATMGGDDLFNGEAQALTAVVCSKSHVFFVRERDAVTKPAPQASQAWTV